MTNRPTAAFRRLEGILALVACGFAVALGPQGDWDLPALAVLVVLAVASELVAVHSASRHILISGSFMAIVITLVILGPAAAVVVGLVSILAGWGRERYERGLLLLNVFAYSWFPLAAGAAFLAARNAAGVDADSGGYYLLALGAFLVALLLNFLIIGGYFSYVERSSFRTKVERTLLPVLPSELASALIALGVVRGYSTLGTPALALAAVGIFVFQYLLGAMLVSQDRADELEIRARELAGFQVAMLAALLRSLDLRDRVMARHSAAVARYARDIAEAVGLTYEEQSDAHTAGLLHDIGKFALPDRILKTTARLTEEDWIAIRRHPHEGARIVGQVDGYQEIAEIILAHHERLDGGGYPNALTGDAIPTLARIVAVADVYDVLTARATYREPSSSSEAITEMRRVSGTQLDGRYVEAMADVLSHKDYAYRHGEDVDFETELALDRRISEAAELAVTPSPTAESARAQANGGSFWSRPN
jgi:putative nucleotidyltransferase with HDIG domain